MNAEASKALVKPSFEIDDSDDLVKPSFEIDDSDSELEEGAFMTFLKSLTDHSLSSAVLLLYFGIFHESITVCIQ
jgi:hypothetical protein